MNLQLKNLPTLYLITPSPNSENDIHLFTRQLEKSLINGIRLIQLRAKNLKAAAYEELAVKVVACCKQYSAVVLLNADPKLANEVNADGVHLDGIRLAEAKSRPFGPEKFLSVACHSQEQIVKAEQIGADMITLSPVLATATHPEAQPLGWKSFSVMAKNTRLPVYALGGMNAGLLSQAQKNGAYGVAGIRSFWNN